jgi:hypothetical protein
MESSRSHTVRAASRRQHMHIHIYTRSSFFLCSALQQQTFQGDLRAHSFFFFFRSLPYFLLAALVQTDAKIFNL